MKEKNENSIENKKIETKGSFSNEVKRVFEEARTETELEADEYHDLVTYKRNNEILWGRVVGVESINEENRSFIVLDWNGIKVLIEDKDFYFDFNNFGKTYDASSDFEKMKRRMRISSYFCNAIICFCVKNVNNITISDKRFKDQKIIEVIGDRIKAMKKLQNIYFYHRNVDTKKLTVNVGDMVEARVLRVKDDMAIVEALGVETIVDSFLLTPEYCNSCNDVCKPGDMLNLYVKKVEILKDKVNLKLTARKLVTPKEIVSMKKFSYYFGVVISFNSEKNMYTVSLSNGVTCAVPVSSVLGNKVLAYGDKVCVYITGIYDSFVIGNAKKC